MKQRMEMYKPGGKVAPSQFDQFETGEFLGDGMEGEVRRISLVRAHTAGDLPLSGLVRKRMHDIHDPDPEIRQRVGDRFFRTMETWSGILNMNRRRRTEGKTTFRLPPTVRGYITDDGEYGFILTDLSRGGTRTVRSFDDLIENMSEGNLPTDEQWRVISARVLTDTQIATEESVTLSAGWNGLDAWMIVTDREGATDVFLADVGFVNLAANKTVVAASDARLRQRMDLLGRVVKGTLSMAQFFNQCT